MVNTTTSQTIFQTVQETSLSKTSVDYTSSGVYKIQSCNLVGCKTDLWNVIVEFKPVLTTIIPQNTHVNETETLEMECTFLGNPTPAAITWKHNGVTITDGGANTITQTTLYTSLFSSSVTSTLSITNIGKTAGDEYECSTSNSKGTTTAAYNVSVCHLPVITTDHPTSEIRLTEGDALTPLTLVVESSPAATLTYYKDGVPLATSPSVTEVNNADPTWYTVEQTSLPYSSAADRTMSGQYNVTACNLLGCVTSQLATLVVQYVPIISYTKNASVIQGDDGTLSCIAHAEPAPTIQWFYGSTGPLSTDTDYQIDETITNHDYYTEVSSNLTIKDVQRLTDVGLYSCKAVNLIGHDEEPLSLSVAYSPIEETVPTDITVNEGDPFNIMYEVRGVPEVTYTWTLNDTVLAPSATTEVDSQPRTVYDIYRSSTYSSTSATPEEGGVYNITASNEHGSVSTPVNVIVLYSPRVTLSSTSKINAGTGPQYLECVVHSNPASTIEWYKDGALLSNNADYDITTSTTSSDSFKTNMTSLLTFQSASKDDSGNYTCKATNNRGTKEVETELIVCYPPIVTPHFPISNQTVDVIEYLWPSLTCNIDSNPVSNVQWFYSSDGGVTYQTVTDLISQQTQTVPNEDYERVFNTSLLFQANGAGIERTDEGMYYCRAQNDLGSAQSDPININVQYAPTFIAPGLMSGSRNATLGGSETFVCRFESDPEATATWQKDGVPISVSDYTTSTISTTADKVVKESRLTITSIESADFATYTCLAQNVAGQSNQEEILNVHFLPTFNPLTQTVVVGEGDSVILNCSALANPIPSYTWVSPDGTNNNGDSLAINSAATSDSGLYNCSATNSEGTSLDHFTVQLIVAIPPNITVTPTCVTSGSVTTCTCAASGDPQPEFYWTKYGENGIFQNGSVLTVPKEEFNDGVYLCHASNAGATVSVPFPVAVFGTLMTEWTYWSGCNNSCGAGTRFRTRLCNLDSCIDPAYESESCIGNCLGVPIPIMSEFEGDPYIALYVLVPIAAVLAAVALIWLARKPSTDDSPLIVPLAPGTAPLVGVPNAGYTPDYESIEVNIPFEDETNLDPMDTEVDTVDRPLTPESFTMDTDSVHDGNIYQSIDNDMPFF
ncbi:hemicentin-1-like [Clytia hemisphaerica]|uniref:Ig-like domain-containing protein n=1 Tax=Clytia hemisphaerica TaxID=252671 RepID=A0A7M5XEG2_9CNID